MRLVVTIDIDMKEAGLDPEEIKKELDGFATELLMLGTIDLDIWAWTLQKAECEGVTWTKQ